MKIGVPKGSIMGPFLYNLYTQELPNVIDIRCTYKEYISRARFENFQESRVQNRPGYRLTIGELRGIQEGNHLKLAESVMCSGRHILRAFKVCARSGLLRGVIRTFQIRCLESS